MLLGVSGFPSVFEEEVGVERSCRIGSGLENPFSLLSFLIPFTPLYYPF